MAQCHFRAKKTGRQIQAKKTWKELDKADIKKFIPYLTTRI